MHELLVGAFRLMGPDYRQSEGVNSLQAKESWDMSAEDKVQAAQKRKELGNKFFKAEKWSRAAKKYKAAGDIIDHDVSDMRPSLLFALMTPTEQLPRNILYLSNRNSTI